MTAKFLVERMLDANLIEKFTTEDFYQALCSDVEYYDELALAELRECVEKRLTYSRSIDNAEAVEALEHLLSAILAFRDSQFYAVTGIEV